MSKNTTKTYGHTKLNATFSQNGLKSHAEISALENEIDSGHSLTLGKLYLNAEASTSKVGIDGQITAAELDGDLGNGFSYRLTAGTGKIGYGSPLPINSKAKETTKTGGGLKKSTELKGLCVEFNAEFEKNKKCNALISAQACVGALGNSITLQDDEFGIFFGKGIYGLGGSVKEVCE